MGGSRDDAEAQDDVLRGAAERGQATRDEHRSNLFHRARMVGLLTLASRILGLIRDGCMASHFGQGAVLDAFTVAFRIPNMARQLFGEGALSTAFLPVFLRDMEHSGKQAAFQTATAVLVAAGAALGGLVAIIELVVFAIRAVAELTYEADLLLNLVAILLPYLMLVCVLAQVCAVMNGLGEFLIPGLFPLLLNALWITSVLLVGQLAPDERTQIDIVAWSVVATGTLQVIVSLAALRFLGFRQQWNWATSRARVSSVVSTMLPVLVGLSIVQLNSAFDSLLAWGLTISTDSAAAPVWYQPLNEGAAAALYLGQRMYQFPLGVFAVALGTVIFPLLTTHAERGEMHLFREDLTRGLRMVMAICIPAAAGMFITSLPLTQLLFERGRFDAADSLQTAAVIGMYSLGVWGACAVLIMNRAFYALGDRITPLRVAMITVGLNILLSLLLVWPLRERGLALGTSVTATLQTVIVGRFLISRVHGLEVRPLVDAFVRTIIATTVMILVCIGSTYFMNEAVPLAGLTSKSLRLAVPVSSGLGVYLVMCRLLGLTEPLELLRRR